MLVFTVLKVEVNGKGLSFNRVTVRIFGANTDAVIDRSRELQVCIHSFIHSFITFLFPMAQELKELVCSN